MGGASERVRRPFLDPLHMGKIELGFLKPRMDWRNVFLMGSILIEIPLRLILLKGPIWQRLFLLAWYFSLVDMACATFVYMDVDATYPDNPTRRDEIWFRMSYLYAIFFGGFLSLSQLACQAIGLILFIVQVTRGKMTEPFGLTLFVLPHFSYWLYRIFMGKLQDGELEAFRQFYLSL